MYTDTVISRVQEYNKSRKKLNQINQNYKATVYRIQYLGQCT